MPRSAPSSTEEGPSGAAAQSAGSCDDDGASSPAEGHGMECAVEIAMRQATHEGFLKQELGTDSYLPESHNIPTKKWRTLEHVFLSRPLLSFLPRALLPGHE